MAIVIATWFSARQNSLRADDLCKLQFQHFLEVCDFFLKIWPHSRLTFIIYLYTYIHLPFVLQILSPIEADMLFMTCPMGNDTP